MPHRDGAQPIPGTPGAVRVRDPASRDQDPVAGRRGRFAERVRRAWNPVPSAALEASRRGDGYDLEALAGAVHARVGGDRDHVLARLREFADLDALGPPAAPDPLVRPGATA